ncbi:MAG: DUF72 domain-containing protein, partial [Desulfobacterales bacterium]|nr:DUF72 domain-containing protein [Desulfobacterales bacterium]
MNADEMKAGGMNQAGNTDAGCPGCRLLIGTSGYSYGEWVDAGFYPPGTHSAAMLPCYAGTFCVTELNYTWYQMPKAEAISRMCDRVPDGFKFAAKLTRTLTHEIKAGQWRSEAARYRQGIAPLVSAGKFLCILIQLPPYFTRTQANRSYLAALQDELSEFSLAVEFRHDSWVRDRVFDELKRRRVTLVAVDEPDLPGLFPRISRVTNPGLFYVRFHGRNSRGWRSGNMQKQFDYDYQDWELTEWADTIHRDMMPAAE